MVKSVDVRITVGVQRQYPQSAHVDVGEFTVRLEPDDGESLNFEDKQRGRLYHAVNQAFLVAMDRGERDDILPQGKRVVVDEDSGMLRLAWRPTSE